MTSISHSSPAMFSQRVSPLSRSRRLPPRTSPNSRRCGRTGCRRIPVATASRVGRADAYRRERRDVHHYVTGVALDPETGKEIWSYEGGWTGFTAGRGLLAGRPAESGANLSLPLAVRLVRLNARHRQSSIPGSAKKAKWTWWCRTIPRPWFTRTCCWWARTPVKPRPRAAGRHARLRCPHRREGVGVSFDAAAGRAGTRDLGGRWLEESLRRQQLGIFADRRRRSAASSTRLSADRIPITGAATVRHNLFGNSVVAMDADTGKLKWYFQVVHHDIFDYDLPPAPG